MSLPNGAHTSRPWRIHELTPEFRLEDVWALPTPGGPDDLPVLVEGLAEADPAQAPLASRASGRCGGSSASSSAGTTRTRAPAHACRPSATGCRPICVTAPRGPDFATAPFTPLYLTTDEFAAEVANQTVHGVMHLGWVPDGSGGCARRWRSS